MWCGWTAPLPFPSLPFRPPPLPFLRIISPDADESTMSGIHVWLHLARYPYHKEWWSGRGLCWAGRLLSLRRSVPALHDYVGQQPYVKTRQRDA